MAGWKSTGVGRDVYQHNGNAVHYVIDHGGWLGGGNVGKEEDRQVQETHGFLHFWRVGTCMPRLAQCLWEKDCQPDRRKRSFDF
jgi:hypothetical protein